MTAAFRMEVLSSSHDRAAFRCGNDGIDRYFRETVTQDVRRGYAKCLNLEHLLPYLTLGPAGEPCVNLYRIAEAFRQVPPGNACAISVQYRLDQTAGYSWR